MRKVPHPILVLVAAAILTAAPAVAAPSAAQTPAGQPPPTTQPDGDSLGADWGLQQYDARAGVKQGRYVPLVKVIDEIRRRTPGRVLDAGLEQAGGRVVYRVRWASDDGRRIDYIADAQSGAILSAN